MKHILFLFLLLISGLVLSAQSRKLTINEIQEHVSECLRTNYHPDSIILSKTCRRGFIFIKFKINKQGEITNLSFSKDSTMFITGALTQAISNLGKDVLLVNTLKETGRTIIQPFIYIYQAGCNLPKITISGTTEEKLKAVGSYLDITGEMDHIDDATFDILNFKDGKLQALDALLLSPIRVASGSME